MEQLRQLTKLNFTEVPDPRGQGAPDTPRLSSGTIPSITDNSLKFLRVNAGETALEWAPSGGGGISDGDKGDVTVSGGGTVWTIDAGVVTLAKMANMATGSLIYRKTAGAGAPEVQTLATLKTDLGLTGTNSGDQTSVTGNAGTATALQTARTISITGKVTSAGGTFDGTGNLALNVTAVTLVAGDIPTIAQSQVTNLVTDLAGKQPLDTQLTDLAALSYAGNALKVVRVNAGATGFELATVSGSGTTVTSAVTTVDFGAFPGATDAKVTITGQAGILAGSKVKAYVIATATADHSADEHWVEEIGVTAGNIIPGTGFDIYVRADDTRLYGLYTLAWEWI